MKVIINFSKRWIYTLIVIGILAIVGVGVYASLGAIPDPGHSVDELQPCSDGEILQMSGDSWSCETPLSGGEDTRCDDSDICSQVCIGSDCKNSWPASLVKGVAVYSMHSYCNSPGLLATSSTCKTICCKVGGSGCINYYTCSGVCSATSSRTCNNVRKGWLVN